MRRIATQKAQVVVRKSASPRRFDLLTRPMGPCDRSATHCGHPAVGGPMSSRAVLPTSCNYLIALAGSFFNPVLARSARPCSSDFLLSAVADPPAAGPLLQSSPSRTRTLRRDLASTSLCLKHRALRLKTPLFHVARSARELRHGSTKWSRRALHETDVNGQWSHMKKRVADCSCADAATRKRSPYRQALQRFINKPRPRP